MLPQSSYTALAYASSSIESCRRGMEPPKKYCKASSPLPRRTERTEADAGTTDGGNDRTMVLRRRSQTSRLPDCRCARRRVRREGRLNRAPSADDDERWERPLVGALLPKSVRLASLPEAVEAQTLSMEVAGAEDFLKRKILLRHIFFVFFFSSHDSKSGQPNMIWIKSFQPNLNVYVQ